MTDTQTKPFESLMLRKLQSVEEIFCLPASNDCCILMNITIFYIFIFQVVQCSVKVFINKVYNGHFIEELREEWSLLILEMKQKVVGSVLRTMNQWVLAIQQLSFHARQ